MERKLREVEKGQQEEVRDEVKKEEERAKVGQISGGDCQVWKVELHARKEQLNCTSKRRINYGVLFSKVRCFSSFWVFFSIYFAGFLILSIIVLLIFFLFSIFYSLGFPSHFPPNVHVVLHLYDFSFSSF